MSFASFLTDELTVQRMAQAFKNHGAVDVPATRRAILKAHGFTPRQIEQLGDEAYRVHQVRMRVGA